MLICLVQLASEMTARGAWGSHPRLRSGPRRRLRRDNFITGYRRFFRTAWLFCCGKLECFIEFVRFKKCSCKVKLLFLSLISKQPIEPTRLRPQRRASRQRQTAPNPMRLKRPNPRGMAARWLASGAKGTSPQPMPNCRCVRYKHTVIKQAHWRLVHKA